MNETPKTEGFHQDPADPRYNRYYDGKEWTDRRVLRSEVKNKDPEPYRDNEAPSQERRKPSYGNIAAPGTPPLAVGRGASGGGPGFFYHPLNWMLRKLFGDHRDRRQR